MVVHVRLTVQKYIKFLHGRPIRTFFYTFLTFNVILHILLGRDALYLLERALQDGAVGEAAVLGHGIVRLASSTRSWAIHSVYFTPRWCSQAVKR